MSELCANQPYLISRLCVDEEFPCRKRVCYYLQIGG